MISAWTRLGHENSRRAGQAAGDPALSRLSRGRPETQADTIGAVRQQPDIDPRAAGTSIEFGRLLRQLRSAAGLTTRTIDAQTIRQPVRLTRAKVSNVELGELPEEQWLHAFLVACGVAVGTRRHREWMHARSALAAASAGHGVAGRTARPLDGAKIALLASFGAERARDLAVWLNGSPYASRPDWPDQILEVVTERYPDLLTPAERGRLRAWLLGQAWTALLQVDGQRAAAPVIDAVAETVFGADNATSHDRLGDRRTYARALIGATWEALVTHLDRANLLTLTIDAQPGESTMSLLCRIRDDHAEAAACGHVHTNTDDVRDAVAEIAAATPCPWPVLDAGKVPLRDTARCAPSRLLRPRHGVVPFAFREAETERLLTWADTAERLSVAVITGSAGTGKTRMAAEICDRLGRRHTSAWRAGFVAIRQPAPPSAPAPAERILAVVDYAEARSSEVVDLMSWMLAAGVQRARLLLLMRQPDSPQDPLNRLRFVRDEVDDVLDGGLSVSLEAAAWDDEQRSSFFGSAGLAFATARHTPPVHQREPAGVTPLEISIEALLAVLADDRGDQTDADTGIQALLRHEERYWQTMAVGAGLAAEAALLRRCIAVVALTADTIRTEHDLVDALRLIPDLEDADQQTLHGFARWVRRTYPSDAEGRYVSSLQPDLIAEELVAAVGLF